MVRVFNANFNIVSAISVSTNYCNITIQFIPYFNKKFKDAKSDIRRHNSKKDNQYNGQKKKDKQ